MQREARARGWFGWYYTKGGGDRVSNTGERPWGGLLAFDLGREMQSKQSVAEELGRRLTVTVPLSLAADHTTQADAPALDQPDARLAFSLMEGQGDSIEDVLGRYLDSQDNVTESATANDNTGFTHAATDTSISAPIMDDPLSYLTVSVDPDQEKLSTMHIM